MFVNSSPSWALPDFHMITFVPMLKGHCDGDQHRGNGEKEELQDDGVPRAPGQPQAAGQRLPRKDRNVSVMVM